MVKKVDFNALRRPKLPLVMKDEQKTTIYVTTPTEALVEELRAAAPELERLYESRNAESVAAAYDLAARLIRCNMAGLQVTGDDLRERYSLDLYDLIFFFEAYTGFIADLSNEKN